MNASRYHSGERMSIRGGVPAGVRTRMDAARKNARPSPRGASGRGKVRRRAATGRS
jgi:hypothetical protein